MKLNQILSYATTAAMCGIAQAATAVDAPTIDIEKFTNGVDADIPTGPLITVGNMATFTYVVTNTGGVPLANVSVTDDQIGSITNLISNGNGDAILDSMESWTYQAIITVTPGQYTNKGTVTADDPMTEQVMDMDDSNHFGVQLDTDGDGVPDDEDLCVESDLSPTVVIDGHDSGVDNYLFVLPGDIFYGCTISDLIAGCADLATNHEEFVSCVAALTNELKKDRIISGKERGAIQKCAAKADLP